MWIFGQVWLWSLLSFVAGVLLTWLVLVRPLKQEVQALRSRTPQAPPPAARDDFDDWPVPVGVEQPRHVAEDERRFEDHPELADDRAEPAYPQSYPQSEPSYPQSEPDEIVRTPFDPAVEAPLDPVDPDSRRAYEDALDQGLVPLSEPIRVFPETPPVRDHEPVDELRRLEEGTERTALIEPWDGMYADDAPEPVAGPHRDEEDEPERPSAAEATTLIPATALAQAIAEVDSRPAEDDGQAWPEHDMTGRFEPVAAEETTTFEVVEEPEPVVAEETPAEETTFLEPVVDEEEQPEVSQPVEPESYRPFSEPGSEEPTAFDPFTEPDPDDYEPLPPAPEPPKFDPFAAPKETFEPFAPTAAEPDEPARPRSLFEPLTDPEDGKELETPRPASSKPVIDQPFVPTLAPELLASMGTPEQPLPTRPATGNNALPQRPRPVGFSPSTGAEPATPSARYQQPEGFNPRSPFGPGSVLPRSDGKAPAPEFEVKATLTGRRYFTAESANFRDTRADVWFRTVADAVKAGFRQSP